jgi:hypothetical protein
MKRNPLKDLHNKIDECTWDIKQEDLFNKAFQEVNGILSERNENDLLRKSEMERQAFAFTKTPEKGLTFKIAGTNKMENGSEVPFEWPNIKDWNTEDFAHIHSRFVNCKNLYAKSEYGLLLYYSGNLKNNNEVTKLLNSLYELANIYLNKSILDDDKEHYFHFFRLVLTNAFFIANKRKNIQEVQNIFKKLILFISKVHNNWNSKHKVTLRTIIDLTEFAIEYKSEFEKYVDLSIYLDQNKNAVDEIAKTNNLGAIYICDVSQRLADKIVNKKYDWQTIKAEQFEAMVQINIEQGNLAAINFVESALSIYKKTKNKKKVAELSKSYEKVRKIFRMGELKQEFPKEETQRISEIIKKEVAEKSSHQLIQVLCNSPMFWSTEQVQKTADELYEKKTFSRLFPSSIIDKYGNTVDAFVDEDEKRKFNFWQSYEFQFQIGTQTLIQFFIESLIANKLSYDNIVEFISQTWIGVTYDELYNGYVHKITPLEVIKPGLKSFFDELEKWKINFSYSTNFVCATDSLVTKTEYLLRFFCKLAGIPTFIDKTKHNGHRIKMEKNIDELLRSLKNTEENPTGFVEDHRVFIQFILAQKVGNNLRHRVAHGLMDAHEYGLANPLLVLIIILKLSSYTFNNISNDKEFANTATDKF